MLIIIVSLILVLEVIRLVVAVWDSRRVAAMNQRILARGEEWEREQKNLRVAEIDALKEMAKDAGRMSQIVEDMKGGKG